MSTVLHYKEKWLLKGKAERAENGFLYSNTVIKTTNNKAAKHKNGRFNKTTLTVVRISTKVGKKIRNKSKNNIDYLSITVQTSYRKPVRLERCDLPSNFPRPLYPLQSNLRY